MRGAITHLLLFCGVCGAQPVVLGAYRVSAYSPSLLRFEFDPLARFDDRPTLAAAARGQPLRLDVRAGNATTSTLTTSALTVWLTHSPPAPFSAANLRVAAAAAGVSWDPASRADAILNGTWLTSLDCYTNDPMDCMNQYENIGAGGPGWTYGMQPGLLSRDGWVLLDDTYSVRLVPPTPPSKIPWWSNATVDAQDWYLNVFGLDYARALRDWVAVLGPPALPPKSALGVWYSRYFPYTEAQLLDEVVGGYAAHGIPLSVIVSDMDVRFLCSLRARARPRGSPPQRRHPPPPPPPTPSPNSVAHGAHRPKLQRLGPVRL